MIANKFKYKIYDETNIFAYFFYKYKNMLSIKNIFIYNKYTVQ
jgi:hypothetical protein